jgi:3-phenylpropionate/trans-cinnamate dioxygenase ferredoxin subunit
MVDEIPSGERKIVTIAGRSIGIFNIDGEYYAMRNRCPHQGAALCEGVLWGALRSTTPGEFKYDATKEILACPWHGWEFSVRTGQSWCDPKRLRVRSYEVQIEDGKMLLVDPEAPIPGMVKGPYVVETFEVSVEGQYLVVDVVEAGNTKPRASDGAHRRRGGRQR